MLKLENKNHFGFSIIELLIVLAVGSIIILGFSTITTNMYSTMKSGEALSQISEVVLGTRQILTNNNACNHNVNNNFTTKVFKSNPGQIDSAIIPVTKIQSPPSGGNPAEDFLVKSNLLPGSSKVRVTDLNLKNFRPLSNNGTSFAADLVMDFERLHGANIGGSNIQRVMTLSLTTTTSGNDSTITGCAVITELTQEQILALDYSGCTSIGGTWDASKNPKCTIPVKPVVQTNCTDVMGSGYMWNGTSCVEIAATDCTKLGSGWVWNGSKCIQTAESLCTQLGYTWSNGKCNAVAEAQGTCTALGGSYNVNNNPPCSIAPPPYKPGTQSCNYMPVGAPNQCELKYHINNSRTIILPVPHSTRIECAYSLGDCSHTHYSYICEDGRWSFNGQEKSACQTD